ncbi:MAG: DUF6427 family protein [Flavicella sp.]
MIANFFNKTTPIKSVLIYSIFILFYFIYKIQHADTLFKGIGVIEIIEHLFSNILFLILCSIIFSRNGFEKTNLYSSLILVLLFGMFPSTLHVDIPLFVNFIFLIVYLKTTEIKDKKDNLASFFDVGFYIGISFVFFNWSVLMMLLLYIGILKIGKAQIRNYIVPIIGFLTPVAIVLIYEYLTDTPLGFVDDFSFSFSNDYSIYENTLLKLPLAVISAITLIAIFTSIPKIYGINDNSRHQYTIALYMLLTSILMVYFSTLKNGVELLYLFIPCALILGQFITDIKKTIVKELFLIATTIFSIVILLNN